MSRAKFKISKYKRIHCIGIGGIHVSAVAKLLLSRGVRVSGSDLVESEITKELQEMGARVFIGHRDTNLRMHTNDTNEDEQALARLQDEGRIDLVIYSDAVPEDNVERVEARRLGIKQFSSYEFVGELSRDYYTIAVSGTNGKSTTTAMLGLILEAGGLDPTVIVGTKVKEWGGNIRLGKSKYLVTEADEYRAHMLKLKPRMIVLTNIEADHLDYYKNIEDIVEHFKKYVKRLPKDGVLVYNKGDSVTARMLDGLSCRRAGYGVSDGCLKLSRMSPNIPDVILQVPGEFNRHNAGVAAMAAKELGIDDEVIKKSLENFRGTWRRFEIVGRRRCPGSLSERDRALIISDYAHHPTAVAETIKAAREMYPDRRLIAVFQPHQHNRTRMLFADFVRVLSESGADVLIVSEIYDVAGRTLGEDKGVSSKDLVEEIKKLRNKEIKDTDYDGLKQITTDYTGTISGLQAFRPSSILYAKDLEETHTLILGSIKPKDAVLIMGAGDVDLVARELVKK